MLPSGAAHSAAGAISYCCTATGHKKSFRVIIAPNLTHPVVLGSISDVPSGLRVQYCSISYAGHEWSGHHAPSLLLIIRKALRNASGEMGDVFRSLTQHYEIGAMYSESSGLLQVNYCHSTAACVSIPVKDV